MTIMLAVSGCGKGDSNKDKNEKQNVSENNNLEYIDSNASCFAPENFEKLIEFLINKYEKFFNR